MTDAQGSRSIRARSSRRGRASVAEATISPGPARATSRDASGRLELRGITGAREVFALIDA